MRFNVPQYITIEDKLLGLITFKQLFLLLGAFIASYTTFKIVGGPIAWIVTLVSFLIAGSLGFMRVNGKSLLSALPRVLSYFLGGKQYFWQASAPTSTKTIEVSVIHKYFLPQEHETESFGIEKNAVPEISEEPLPEMPKIPIPKTIPQRQKEEGVTEFKKTQPLVRYIQYAHKHGQNPVNPYRYFPLPHFPKRQW
ncbi:MAG: hypothetical protein UU76_C0003G0015 [Parcubacteria group bacterium GW2011_GWC1_41_7]|nr:MAG: hypothetical protein UU76_C0003G0015 [Parcubacteria group bacterium GW2011_GWC1_41_7]